MSARREKSGGVRQLEDQVPGRRVVLAFGVVLALSGGGVFWAWRILRAQEAALGARPGLETPEPKRVLATLFSEDRAGERQRAEDSRRLERYEWVDRERRIVRIPIERAMEIVARERREGGK